MNDFIYIELNIARCTKNSYDEFGKKSVPQCWPLYNGIV